MDKSLEAKIEKILSCEQIGQFSAIAITEKKALKKSRITKTPTPDLISVLKKVQTFSCFLGKNYNYLVNLKRENEGKETDFVALTSYLVPYKNSKILFVHKDNPEKFYIRIYANICGEYSGSSTYLDKNNQKVNFRELQKEYFDLPNENSSSRQELDSEVLVFNFKLENIKFLKRGEEILINEIEEIQQDLMIHRDNVKAS